VVTLRLVGAAPHARLVALRRLPGVVNYLIGRDARRWRTGVPTYAAVAYRGVYPGVDLVYYGARGRLEYDWRLAPGADPRRIRLAVALAGTGTDGAGTDGAGVGAGVGHAAPRLDARGALVLRTVAGDIVQRAPVVYQLVGGRRRPVAARFAPSRRGSPRRGRARSASRWAATTAAARSSSTRRCSTRPTSAGPATT